MIDSRITGKRTIYGLQILRGVAALLVVVCHVVPGAILGNAGVDLFFVISGFVIVWTTNGRWLEKLAWLTFLKKRVLRIFPLYWILTTGKIVVVLAMPSLFRDPQLLPWNTVASYLLIPSRDAVGKISPVMSTGWTLCFEMAFYYACAACLAMKVRPVMYLTPTFLVLGLAGIGHIGDWGPVTTLFDPLLLEFLAGMWIAHLTLRGDYMGSPRTSGILFTLGLFLLLSSAFLDPAIARAWRVLVWGLPAAMIVQATIGIESRFNFGKLRLLLLLGDASYSIYLAHVLVIGAVIRPIRQLVVPVAGNAGMYLVLIVAGVVGGVVVWHVVERKVIGGVMSKSPAYRKAWLQPR